MDQTGSLVDTKLKIIPSEALRTFLKKIDVCENLPENISKVIIGKYYKTVKSTSNHKLKFNIDLTDKEREFLNKCITIRETSSKQVVEKEGNETAEKNTDTILKKNIDKEDKILQNTSHEHSFNENNQEAKDCPKAGPEEDTKLNKSISKSYSNVEVYLETCDIDWLYSYVRQKQIEGQDVPYLHELLENCEILLPENEVIKRNPDLEARCVKLRAQQQAREYRAMTKSVDNVRRKMPEDTVAYQLKQLNRQLIAIGQFIISIFAGFLFGFKGIDWMLGPLDFGFRLLMGVMCALIIALAEIYFLAKKLNEEMAFSESGVGGLPSFVEEYQKAQKKIHAEKEHQD